MRDQIVRQAFHNTVLKSAHADAHTIVVDELGLKNGGIRADIAVVNGKLVGYEIKTEKDTLSRLPSQIQAYNEVFEKAFIIVSENHLANALKLIPDWWGIYKIKIKGDGSLTFPCHRKARINKARNPYTIACLLWKPEVLEIVNSFSKMSIRSNIPKRAIYETICQNYTEKNIGKMVIQYLKQRDNWR